MSTDNGIVSKKYPKYRSMTKLTLATAAVTFIVIQLTTLPTAKSATVPGVSDNHSNDAAGKQITVNDTLQDVYATISKNMGENSRKLNLEDFSWGIFSGSKGRLQGFGHFQLVNNETVATTHPRKLNLSFQFTVPTLSAVWEKSICLGYGCVMTMELNQAVFALKVSFDADDCMFEHLAFLKSYSDARCFVSYLKTSSIPSSFVQTTVKLLSRVMNTQPFQKIIKDNVDYALLQLPLFNAADVARICDRYRQQI